MGAGGPYIGIYDAGGKLIRELTSVAPPPEPEPQLTVPNYWMGGPSASAAAGMNRAVWDLRYSLPPSFTRGATNSYPIRRSMAILPRSREVRWWLPAITKCA